MRSRRTILEDWKSVCICEAQIERGFSLVIELLLDLRDMAASLDPRPAVKYPESPPPPEVKK